MRIDIPERNTLKITLIVFVLFLCVAAMSLLITGKKLYMVSGGDVINIESSAIGIVGVEFLLAWILWLGMLNRRKCVFKTAGRKIYVYDIKKAKACRTVLENIYEVSFHKKEKMIKIFYTENYLKDFKIRFDELFFYDKNAYYAEYNKEIKTADLYLAEVSCLERESVYDYFKNNVSETVDFDKEISALYFAVKKGVNNR